MTICNYLVLFGIIGKMTKAKKNCNYLELSRLRFDDITLLNATTLEGTNVPNPPMNKPGGGGSTWWPPNISRGLLFARGDF